jgi:hypothetical protein
MKKNIETVDINTVRLTVLESVDIEVDEVVGSRAGNSRASPS